MTKEQEILNRLEKKSSGKGRIIFGIILIGFGIIFLAERFFPYFDFDEGVLPIGSAFLAQVAWQALHQKELFTPPAGNLSSAMNLQDSADEQGKK